MNDYANERPWVSRAIRHGDHVPPGQVAVMLAELDRKSQRVADLEDRLRVHAERELAGRGSTVTTDEVYRWHVGRFGHLDVRMVALKLAEEAGEVCGAVVKRAEGAVRPAKGLTTREDWTRALHDEMGDVAIVLNVLAGREGTTVDELLRRRFRDDVALRTGQEHPRDDRNPGPRPEEEQ